MPSGLGISEQWWLKVNQRCWDAMLEAVAEGCVGMAHTAGSIIVVWPSAAQSPTDAAQCDRLSPCKIVHHE